MLSLKQLDLIKIQIKSIISEYWNERGKSKIKEDGTLVTNADLQISNYFEKNIVTDFFGSASFYCEENRPDTLGFPCCILDPIDGTREFAEGRADYAVSFAYMASESIDDPNNVGWVYAPAADLSVLSTETFLEAKFTEKDVLTGFVSRTDHEAGRFLNLLCEKVEFVPRGSIAFKLGLLAIGACDFVYSITDKNIWDIAAGCILLKSRGYNTYDKSGEVTQLVDERLKGPMIWCRECDFDCLRGLLD